MNHISDAGVLADPATGRTSYTHRLRGLAVTGFTATLAAMVATALSAALARAVGVDFQKAGGKPAARLVQVRDAIASGVVWHQAPRSTTTSPRLMTISTALRPSR